MKHWSELILLLLLAFASQASGAGDAVRGIVKPVVQLIDDVPASCVTPSGSSSFQPITDPSRLLPAPQQPVALLPENVAAQTGVLRVKPAELRLPPTRIEGADPFKLADQNRRYGTSTEGMPPIQVTRGANNEMIINDGVTRAARAAMIPGTTVPVEVIEHNPVLNFQHLPRVGEKVPGKP